MFNAEKSAKLCAVDLEFLRLSQICKPYAFLIRPLQTFLTTCTEPTPFASTPFVTVKALFELFISSYLGEHYDPLQMVETINKQRRLEKRLALAVSSRSVPGRSPVVSIPTVMFSSLLESVLRSNDYHKATDAKLESDFAEGKIPAAKLALVPSFRAFAERVGSSRTLIVRNLQILPVGNALPDDVLSVIDPRFASDPDLSRATFPRFNTSELVREYLSEHETRGLNREFEALSHCFELRKKKNTLVYQEKLGNLLAARVLSGSDSAYLDREALSRMSVLKNVDAGVGPGGYPSSLLF